jgi:hypothetical protein
MRAVPCLVPNDEFLFNRRFRVISGGEWFADGELRFHERDPVDDGTAPYLDTHPTDGTYKECYGFLFPNNSKIYADTDHTLSMSLRRLTCVNQPEYPGLGLQLMHRQSNFIDRHLPVLRELRAAYGEQFRTWEGWLQFCFDHHGDAHIKRQLRIQAFQDIMENGVIHLDLWLEAFTYKTKKGEVAKPGKKSRGIGDLGVAASLQGFGYTKYLKQAQACHTYVHNGFTIQFVPKPTSTALTAVFNLLMNPPGRGYFVYFSDDSCVSINTPAGVRSFNVDISSCDKSHSPRLFEAMYDITPDIAHAGVTATLRQCMAPMTLRSVRLKGTPYSKSTQRKVKLQIDSIALPSGSTITTAINNLANNLIAFAFSEVDWDTVADDDVIRQLHLAASQCGYVVTIDSCKKPGDIQFLKHSPCLDIHGEYKPVLNAGVFLRASGCCRGDLPGSGPKKPRAEYFQSQLLNGMYPRVSTPFLDIMKRNLQTAHPGGERQVRQVAKLVAEKLRYKVCSNDEEMITVTSEEFFARYNLRPDEIASMLEIAEHAGYEVCHATSGTDKIFKADYGLRSKTFEACVP